MLRLAEGQRHRDNVEGTTPEAYYRRVMRVPMLDTFISEINFRFSSFMTESLSCRNHSIDLQSKSMDWFLYGRDLRHERVNKLSVTESKLLYLVPSFIAEEPDYVLKLKPVICMCESDLLN